MKTTSCIILFVLCFNFHSAVAQNTRLIDTLERNLPQKEDTIRVLRLQDIAWQYKSIDPLKAIQFSREALVLSQKLNYKSGIAKSYIIEGVVHSIQGDYTKAIDSYQQCLAIRREMKYMKGVSSILNNIGLAYYYEASYDLALDYLQQSLKLEEGFGDKVMVAENLVNIGDVYAALGRYNDALHNYKSYLQMLGKEADDYGKAFVYNCIGKAYDGLNKTDSAAKYFLLALHLSEKLGDKQSIAGNLSKLGSLNMQSGNYVQSVTMLKKAIALDYEIADKQSLSNDYISLSQSLLKQNKMSEGFAAADSGLKLARKIKAKENIKHAYHTFSEGYELKGDLKKALIYRRMYSAVSDSILNEKSAKRLVELQTKFETNQKENKITLLTQQKEIKSLEAGRRKAERNVLILLIALIVLGAIPYFRTRRIKQKLRELELQQKLQQERERISRDLHDNVGSQLSFIINNIDVTAKSKLDEEKQIKKLNLINEIAHASIDSLRETIWALNKEYITVDDFALKIRQYIGKQLEMRPDITFHVEEKLEKNPQLRPMQSLNLFRIAQETIGNAIKHADCSHIETIVSVTNSQLLTLHISDNGKGYTNEKPADDREHHGLVNMRSRADEMGAKINIQSITGKGTTVEVILQLA